MTKKNDFQELFFWAKDENGKLVHAVMANRKKTYYCRFCGCPMHIVHRNGKAFFAHYPNRPHTLQICKHPKRILRDIAITDPVKFLDSLLTPKEHTNTNTTNTFGQARELNSGVLAFTSLRDLYHIGVHIFPLIDDQVDKRNLSEFILLPGKIPTIMNSNEALGKLVLIARKDGYDNDLQALRFVLLDHGPLLRKKVFLLVFGNKYRKDYLNFQKRLYFSADSGNINNVFVVADWVAASYPNCKMVCSKKCPYYDQAMAPNQNDTKSTWECTHMQTGIFVNPGQIFIPPNDELVINK